MSESSAAVTLEDLKNQFRNYQRYATWAYRLVVAWAVLAGAWMYQAHSSSLTLAQAGFLIALGLATVKARQILLNQAEAKFQKFFVLLPGYASVTGPNNAYSEIISQYQKGNRALVCGLIGMFLDLEGMGMALIKSRASEQSLDR